MASHTFYDICSISVTSAALLLVSLAIPWPFQDIKYVDIHNNTFEKVGVPPCNFVKYS